MARLKVDKNGEPILDADGHLQLDDSGESPVVATPAEETDAPSDPGPANINLPDEVWTDPNEQVGTVKPTSATPLPPEAIAAIESHPDAPGADGDASLGQGASVPASTGLTTSHPSGSGQGAAQRARQHLAEAGQHFEQAQSSYQAGQASLGNAARELDSGV